MEMSRVEIAGKTYLKPYLKISLLNYVKLKNKIHVFIIGKKDANKKSFFPCMNSFCYGKIILSELFFITSHEDIDHQSTINHVAIEYHAWFSLIQQ